MFLNTKLLRSLSTEQHEGRRETLKTALMTSTYFGFVREEQLSCFLSQAFWNRFNELRLPKGGKISNKSGVFKLTVLRSGLLSPSTDARPVRREDETDVYVFVPVLIITI